MVERLCAFFLAELMISTSPETKRSHKHQWQTSNLEWWLPLDTSACCLQWMVRVSPAGWSGLQSNWLLLQRYFWFDIDSLNPIVVSIPFRLLPSFQGGKVKKIISFCFPIHYWLMVQKSGHNQLILGKESHFFYDLFKNIYSTLYLYRPVLSEPNHTTVASHIIPGVPLPRFLRLPNCKESIFRTTGDVAFGWTRMFIAAGSLCREWPLCLETS